MRLHNRTGQRHDTQGSNSGEQSVNDQEENLPRIAFSEASLIPIEVSCFLWVRKAGRDKVRAIEDSAGNSGRQFWSTRAKSRPLRSVTGSICLRTAVAAQKNGAENQSAPPFPQPLAPRPRASSCSKILRLA